MKKEAHMPPYNRPFAPGLGFDEPGSDPGPEPDPGTGGTTTGGDDNGPVQGGPSGSAEQGPSDPGSTGDETTPEAPTGDPGPPPDEEPGDPGTGDGGDVGDIPPPPTPPEGGVVGPGVGGLPGTEAGTLSLPGTRGVFPFHTAAFQPRPKRFGPGAPITAIGDTGEGLPNPDDAAEILRQLALGRVQ